MADARIETSEHDEIQELSKREMEEVTGGDGTRGSGNDLLFGGAGTERLRGAYNPYVTVDYLGM